MINERIKRLRIERGLTQQNVADAVHTDKTNVSSWENGRYMPSKSVLTLLADFFDVSVDYLLGRTDIPYPLKDEVELNDENPCPLVGRVVAGTPIEAQENLEGYIYIKYKPANEYFATLTVGERFLSTSGSYEKQFTENGKTYHHILDLTTGYPAETQLVSVTIVAQTGLQSDALSTLCFLLGEEDSCEVLELYNAQLEKLGDMMEAPAAAEKAQAEQKIEETDKNIEAVSARIDEIEQELDEPQEEPQNEPQEAPAADDGWEDISSYRVFTLTFAKL